jgi:hypothetical protein
MGSTSHTSACSESDTQHDPAEILAAAKLLIDEHGSGADIVAARRADALFLDGNATEGKTWLKIFRSIAMTRVSRAT